MFTQEDSRPIYLSRSEARQAAEELDRLRDQHPKGPLDFYKRNRALGELLQHLRSIAEDPRS